MKWIKKPIVVEAVQYKEYGKLVKGMCNSVSCYTEGNNKPHVHTIHDNQIVLLEVGDYIIPEPDGEHYYPCKPDIFEKTYSPFDESINQEGSLKDSDWESRKYFPLDERLKKIDWIADSVDLEYCAKYDRALQLAEARIEELENVIAPLLQNEYKGDDLVAEASTNEGAALATHYVHPHNNIERGLKPEHKCIPIARAQMSEGRDWWLGKITETVKEFPVETHCLHLKTPLKDVVFLCNAGDFQQLSVLCRHALGYPINESWMESQLEITALPNTSSQTLTQIEQDKKQTL